jgi:hypothetical protein
MGIHFSRVSCGVCADRKLLQATSSGSLSNTTLRKLAVRGDRRDPTNGFKKYRDGYDVKNKHYWAVLHWTSSDSPLVLLSSKLRFCYLMVALTWRCFLWRWFWSLLFHVSANRKVLYGCSQRCTRGFTASPLVWHGCCWERSSLCWLASGAVAAEGGCPMRPAIEPTSGFLCIIPSYLETWKLGDLSLEWWFGNSSLVRVERLSLTLR